MDWNLAISCNRDQLLRIIASLFALLRLDPATSLVGGAQTVTVPRHVYRAVLLVLRPAESAVRRLIIIAACGLVLKVRAARPAIKHSGAFPSIALPTIPAFPLIDPRKRFSQGTLVWGQVKTIPHIRTFSTFEPLVAPVWPPFNPVHQAPRADDPINATGLCRRLNSLKSVLEDLTKQARRLARLKARQALAKQGQKPFRPSLLSPTRPGPPPGFRKRAVREIDHVLRECHALVLDLYAGDT